MRKILRDFVQLHHHLTAHHGQPLPLEYHNKSTLHVYQDRCQSVNPVVRSPTRNGTRAELVRDNEVMQISNWKCCRRRPLRGNGLHYVELLGKRIKPQQDDDTFLSSPSQ